MAAQERKTTDVGVGTSTDPPEEEEDHTFLTTLTTIPHKNISKRFKKKEGRFLSFRFR